jgi:cell division initiation protein
MLSLNDIKNKRFQKASLRGGYMREEVDDFLDEVESSYTALIQKTAQQHDELEHKKNEMRQMQEKMKSMQEQIQKYCAEEDEIKEALLSAQKMRDAALREAHQQADSIVADANRKAKGIVTEASQEIEGEQEKLQAMKQAVSDFRSQLLRVYKQHLTLINALPHMEKKQPQPAPAPAVQPQPAPAPAVQPQPEKEPSYPQEAAAPAAKQEAPAAAEAEPEEEPCYPQEAAAPAAKKGPVPVTFADELDEPDYLTAKPFAPVKNENKADKSVSSFADDYDLDDEDASEIFSKKH